MKKVISLLFAIVTICVKKGMIEAEIQSAFGGADPNRQMANALKDVNKELAANATLTEALKNKYAGFTGGFVKFKETLGKIPGILAKIAPQLTIIGGLIATVFIAKKFADYGMRV